jgi:hypothetical protein
MAFATAYLRLAAKFNSLGLLLALTISTTQGARTIKMVEPLQLSYLDTEVADRFSAGHNLGPTTLSSFEDWQREAQLNVTQWHNLLFAETMQVQPGGAKPY